MGVDSRNNSRLDLPRFLIFASVYVLAVVCSEYLSSGPTPFGLPDSVLLCALLVTRRRHWWVSILAVWLIRLGLGAAFGTHPLWFFAYAIANDSAKALLAAWWMERVLRAPVRLNTLRQFAVFLGIAAAAVPLLSAFAAIPVFHAMGDTAWGGFYRWFLRDSLAQATVTPALLFWVTRDFSHADWPAKEDLLVFSGLAVTLGNAFLLHHAAISLVTIYAPIPFLIWAAARLSPFAAANAVALISFATVLDTRNQTGFSLPPSTSDVAFSTSLVTLLVSIPLLSFSILRSEKEQQARKFRALLDARPIAALMAPEPGQNHEGRDKGQAETGRVLDEIAHLNRVASMGHMAASVAHELNQPLSAILSNAQAAERFASAHAPNLEEVRSALEDIIEDDKRARSIVRHMLQVFKRHALTAHVVDLNEIVRDADRLARHDALLRGVQLQCRLLNQPIWISGDDIPLQQVIFNLVTNGMDAMRHLPSEQRVVTIETTISEANGFATVAVTDSGTGVSPEDQSKLFTPFFTTKPDGLGLGLSICQSIVHALGGHITVESRPERGAVFFVMLPLSRPAQLRSSRANAA